MKRMVSISRPIIGQDFLSQQMALNRNIREYGIYLKSKVGSYLDIEIEW